METLGEYLKRERERRNISLREISKNTRVREHVLRAIEEDRVDLLPPATYVRGFLLAYARYIGIDPNDILLRYEGDKRGNKGEDKREDKGEDKGEPVFRQEIIPVEKKEPRSTKPFWIIGVVIVVSLVASYFLYPSRPSQPPVDTSPAQPKVEEKERDLPDSPPIYEPPPAPPPAAQTIPVPETKPLSLQIKAIEETWVSIRVNGQPEKEVTFKPGEGLSIQASDHIQLNVGNAGGLEIVFNGKLLEKFGKSKEVVTLTFTLQGVEMKRPEKPKSP